MIKIALISNDKIGKTMAGPGIRYFELAKAFAAHFEVILALPGKTDIEADNFNIIAYNPTLPSRDLAKRLKDCQVVIAQNLWPALIFFLKRQGIKYIADLYDPLVIEVLEYTRHDPSRQQKLTYDFNYHSLMLQLKSADHLLCASDRQRDFYLGLLAAEKLITPESYKGSPDFSRFISLAPFGLPVTPPKMTGGAKIKELFPAIKSADHLLYWGGGIWDWFDPLSAIKATEIIAKKRDDIKLIFLAGRHPNQKIKNMAAAAEAYDYCQKNNLLDRVVFFNQHWTPYQDRTNFLLRASIGISTHFHNLETRFAFRTRILDYLWAELPIIITEGDVMAELVAKHNLGFTVRYGNVDDIIRAISEIIDNPKLQREIKANIKKVKEQFTWPAVVEPIIHLIGNNLIPRHKIGPFELLLLSLNFYLAGFKKKVLKRA